MLPIRVLVVDDSVVARRLVGTVISASPELELAGIAANGRIALSRIPQVNPDVVILDVEMPELGGLETLVEIRKTYPGLAVIMFSALTERGGVTTLDALTLGASDYVTKPSGMADWGSGLEQVRAELVPKILALGVRAASGGFRPTLQPDRGSMRPVQARVPGPVHSVPPRLSFPAAPGASEVSRLPPAGAPGSPIDIVAIGSSTGGPNALADVLGALPAGFPVPIVITQHMPPMFTRLLAERLDVKCPLAIREAEAGAVLEPGSVWVAPGDHHLVIRKEGGVTRLDLNQDPPENACRPAVDVMMRSVVAAFGSRVLAVILTGMGQDGTRGCRLVRERGGLVFAQDEASSVVWGMPGFVVRAGLAQRVVALAGMAEAVEEAVASSRRQTRLWDASEKGSKHAD